MSKNICMSIACTIALAACGEPIEDLPINDSDTQGTVADTVDPNDLDGDGVPSELDCDDSNPSNTQTVPLNDLDCDGAIANEDCDDNDPLLGSFVNDNDCDGVSSSSDCNDNDTSFGSQLFDRDCDGTLATDDCNDEDPASTIVAEDADCDGTLTTDDCDDNDPTSSIVPEDADCDGIPTLDDCDDTDPSTENDMDCDGVLKADDCDDNSAVLGAIVLDQDCDGVVATEDCDDDEFTMPNEDADCDGVLTVDDCDDTTAALGAILLDNDCDSILEADDCDDNDYIYGSILEDPDCDGLLGEDDNDWILLWDHRLDALPANTTTVFGAQYADTIDGHLGWVMGSNANVLDISIPSRNTIEASIEAVVVDVFIPYGSRVRIATTATYGYDTDMWSGLCSWTYFVTGEQVNDSYTHEFGEWQTFRVDLIYSSNEMALYVDGNNASLVTTAGTLPLVDSNKEFVFLAGYGSMGQPAEVAWKNLRIFYTE